MKLITINEVKKRWILFAVIFLLFSMLSYRFAFKNTFELFLAFVQQKSMSKQLDNKQLSFSIDESKKVANYLANYSTDTLMIQKLLLDSINTKCIKFNCHITSFPKSYISNEFNYVLLNHMIELEGNYFSLIKIIYDIENSTFYGKINASKFYVIEDFRTKNKVLRLQLHLQHLTSI